MFINVVFVYLWHSRCCSVCHLLGRNLQNKKTKYIIFFFFYRDYVGNIYNKLALSP